MKILDIGVLEMSLYVLLRTGKVINQGGELGVFCIYCSEVKEHVNHTKSSKHPFPLLLNTLRYLVIEKIIFYKA